MIASLLRLVLAGVAHANLAREISERANRYGRAGAMLVLAGLFCIMAFGVLVGVGWIALSQRIGAEYAGLSIAGGLILLGAIIGLIGLNMAQRQKEPTKPQSNPLDGITKALPEVMTALRPYLLEIVTTAIVLSLLSKWRGKSKDADD